MKIILRTLFPAVLLLAFLSGTAVAQTKIATVDLQKLMENFWKSKVAVKSIQATRDQIEKDDKQMRDDLQKATDEYQQLLTQANDPAISADERNRRQQTAADEKKQLDARAAAINQSEQLAEANQADQVQHMSEKIRAEIQTRVNDVAKAGGYALVLNTADATVTVGAGRIAMPSPVVYGASEIDLTDAVLKQLNAGAPIDLTNSVAASASQPAPSSSNTNKP